MTGDLLSDIFHQGFVIRSLYFFFSTRSFFNQSSSLVFASSFLFFARCTYVPTQSSQKLLRHFLGISERTTAVRANSEGYLRFRTWVFCMMALKSFHRLRKHDRSKSNAATNSTSPHPSLENVSRFFVYAVWSALCRPDRYWRLKRSMVRCAAAEGRSLAGRQVSLQTHPCLLTTADPVTWICLICQWATVSMREDRSVGSRQRGACWLSKDQANLICWENWNQGLIGNAFGAFYMRSTRNLRIECSTIAA
ncbi:hypothetical protein K491DRAFT_347117 [Lophiostoma macrostomum CBS 122681]|uniref:Uncharacterized protein n=1 Tax=Lophiostoma macrostomum CBS 122681 TaxID=1314788 RepID=A0A6A6TBL3_9PLEO|nr:hypothetical protein K491DRAFT_347117 [Lophiostoma macrostomum CBS 122681]